MLVIFQIFWSRKSFNFFNNSKQKYFQPALARSVNMKQNTSHDSCACSRERASKIRSFFCFQLIMNNIILQALPITN